MQIRYTSGGLMGASCQGMASGSNYPERSIIQPDRVDANGYSINDHLRAVWAARDDMNSLFTAASTPAGLWARNLTGRLRFRLRVDPILKRAGLGIG